MTTTSENIQHVDEYTDAGMDMDNGQHVSYSQLRHWLWTLKEDVRDIMPSASDYERRAFRDAMDSAQAALGWIEAR